MKNNKEIKFRAWYPYGDGGEMVDDIWIDLERGSILSDNDDLCEREGHSGAILMQFTGLKDKNGKEIYEGDIVSVDWNDKRYEIHNVEVKWNYEDLCWEIEGGCLTMDYIHFEVIGNIYENPNLLT